MRLLFQHVNCHQLCLIAKATTDHKKSWLNSTENISVSMTVISDRSEYGAPWDVIFSFPRTIEGKEWKTVNGLQFDDTVQQRVELLDEIREALCTKKEHLQTTTTMYFDTFFILFEQNCSSLKNQIKFVTFYDQDVFFTDFLSASIEFY